MSLKLYRRKGSDVWHYRGTVAGERLRGSCRTESRKDAAGVASTIEHRQRDRNIYGSKEVLTFPQAVGFYLKAGKSDRFLAKIEDYWKDSKVKDMTAGAIRQSAIDLFPGCSGATMNRQVITPTQAVINHCAEMEKCAPIRVRRFKFERKIKKPIMVEWLNAFCAHARPLNVALSTFMFSTACRISEARRLEWRHIDFQQRSILIVKTKNKHQRLPHMPQRLLVALANLPRETKPFGLPESTLRRHWDQDVEITAAAVPGFERLTFHSCRHGFATKMLRDGVDPKTAATLGGWESIGLFMETYAHAMQDTSLTERLFDTELTQQKTDANENNGLG